MASANNDIKHVIAVSSGKGGVGKSFVSGMLAVALMKKGFKVGILDADLTGPSIPKMFGVKDGLMMDADQNLVPPVTFNIVDCCRNSLHKMCFIKCT